MVTKNDIIEEVNGRFKEVFEYIREEYGIKVSKLSKELGYKTSRQLYHIFNNDALVPSSAISLMCIGYQINPNYIILGTGTMCVDDLDNDTLEDYKTMDFLQQEKINKLKSLVKVLKTTVNVLTA